MKLISRNVWILSIVSLFTDMASEMLYPILPVYLKSIGFSVLLIGVLEGIAEATAGLSKGYFGQWSDRVGRRLPFVQTGYALSAVAKPMLALLSAPLWVFFSRTLDRLGKGIRTGARDALLSDESRPETKGRVFGFHRSFDTLGAVIGPLLALVFLHFYPEEYTLLFFWAFIPGLVAIAFTVIVREKKKVKVDNKTHPGFFDFLHYWKRSPSQYRQLAGGLLFFSVFNSADVFLLIHLKDAGASDSVVIGMYIFYNLVYAAAAFPFGILADRMGMKRVFVLGLILFSTVYAGMAVVATLPVFAGLFLLYGMYAAATEGVAKAWLTNICAKEETATAIGTFTAFQSVGALMASSLAGLIWYWFGPSAVFMMSAVAGIGVAWYVWRIESTSDNKQSP